MKHEEGIHEMIARLKAKADLRRQEIPEQGVPPVQIGRVVEEAMAKASSFPKKAKKKWEGPVPPPQKGPYRYYAPPTKSVNLPVLCRAVLEVLLSVARHHKKFYCYPSQKKILQLLEEHQRIRICRSTLNRVLGWLGIYKFFERIRRHKKVSERTGFGKDGHMRPCSTLYKFLPKTFAYLRGLGKAVLDLFSHFKVPTWDRENIRYGKSTLFKSIKKFLVGQGVAGDVAGRALGLRV